MSVASAIIALAVTLGLPGAARAVGAYHLNTRNESDAYVLVYAHLLSGPRESGGPWCVRPRTYDQHDLVFKAIGVSFVILRDGCPSLSHTVLLKVERIFPARENTWTFEVSGRATTRNPIPYDVK